MAEKKIDLISAQDGCGDDRPLSWVLADVHRLKPGFQTRTMEDIDWLLKRRIAFQLSQLGIPVRIPQRTVGLGRRMYTILAGSLLVKRIRMRLSGVVDVVSDNERYGTETISGEQLTSLQIVGRVVWQGRRV